MQLEVGAVLEGKVTGITKFGAFVELPEKKTGMVHISEVASTYVKEIRDFITEGQTVKVKVLSRPDNVEWNSSAPRSESFEDMMSRFKAASDEKFSDIKRSMDSKHGGFTRKTPRGGQ